MKKWSISLIIREIQVKTTEIPPVRWLKLTTQATTDVGKDVEKEESFSAVDGNANWCSHSGKQYGGSLKN